MGTLVKPGRGMAHVVARTDLSGGYWQIGFGILVLLLLPLLLW